MKPARTAHYLTSFVLCIVTCFMIINTGEGFITAMANERNLIRDTARYGSYYQKDLNTETVEPKTVVIGEREQVEREPELEKEVEDYDASQEVIENRTENTKTFHQEDGTRVTKQYFEPVHKKENGKWVDIDDTLKKQTSLFRSDTNEFENEEGILSVRFNTDTVQVESDIEIIADGDLSSFVVKENAILYNHVLDQVDIQYDVRSNHLFQEANLYSRDTKTFSYLLKTDAELENKEGNLYIYADEEYVISAPILKDRDGKTSLNTEVEVVEEEDAYRVTYTLDSAFMEAEDTAYPVAVSNGLTRASTVSMDTSYIRSASPNITSAYNHLMIGYDKNGTVSGLGNPNIIGTARSFFSFDMPNLGANRRLVSASLVLYKFSDFGDAEVPQINVYDTNGRVNANAVTWNNQPGNLTYVSSNASLRGQSYKAFDITSAAKKMLSGTPTSIMMRAADESSNYYMLAFYSESTGSRPYIEIVDQADYDFNPDMGIDSFHEYFRYYTAGYNQFKGISIDGIAKPNSKVNFDLYEKTSTNETKVKTTSTSSSLNKINPIFVSNPLAGVQKYTAGATNYTSGYINQSFFPKKDTLYNFHVSVEKDGSKSKELITDTSMIYTVKLGDNLQTIATHYGLTVGDLQKSNNTSEKKIKEGDILYINYPNANPYLSEDMYKPPTRISIYMAEYKYRGPNCVGKCDVADPISVSTGNFYHEAKDFTLSDYEDLFMQRTYNSLGEANTSIFGLGFSSNLEQRLSYDKNDNILYYASNGQILKFQKDGKVYSDDHNYSITKETDSYKVYNKDTGETSNFNGYGTLTSIKTKKDHYTLLYYDRYGKLTNIGFGKKAITFEYYPKRNLVKSITMPNNAKVQYKYNSNSQLIEFIDALGKSETYNYDSKGKINSIKTRNGDTIAQNTYDSKGRVLTQKDGVGNLTKFTYNANDVIVQYQDGEKKTYTYTDDYNISAIVNSDGTSNQYAYENGSQMPKTEIDGEGKKINHFYDEKQQLIKTVYPDETYETYTYDEQGNVTEHRTPDGKVEKFVFSKRNLMTSKIDSNGKEILYLYYHENNKLWQEVTLDNSMYNVYEYEGNQISKKTTNTGLETNYIYDSVGNIIKEYDNNGRYTIYTYDQKSQILSKTDALGNVESYAYDGNGNVTQYVDKLGAKTVNTYDGNNNLVQTTRGTLTTKKTYDSLNRITSEADEQGLCKRYEYDPAGNISKEIDVYGNATTYTYDKAGHQLSKTDAQGNTTTYTYNINNLVSETDALGNTTTYTYDDKGRVISTTKPNGKTETTEYNEFGNVISNTNERGVVITKGYDKRQRVAYEQNDKGQLFMYYYDNYDRLIKKIDGKVTTYTYDMYNNELTKTSSLGRTITKTYDALNQLVSETDGMGGTITHEYDAEGNEIKTIDQNGNETRTIYDIYGFKLQDIDALGNATTYTYNGKGQIATITNAKGVKTSYTYDAYNHEIKQVIQNIIVSSKKYDTYGRITEEKTPSEGKAFVYDAHNRVIEERNLVTGLITKKTYDRFSNITKESDNGNHSFTREYSPYQELVNSTDSYGRVEKRVYNKYGNLITLLDYENGIEYYTYDVNDNVLTQNDNHFNTTKMVYDELDQLTTSTSPQGVITTYTYDKAGRNISIHDSFTNKTSYTSYDAVGNVIQTTDQAGAVTNNTYDAKNQLIEVKDGLGNITKYEYDALGNLIKTTDATGCSSQSEYNAFGLISKEVDERWFATTYEYNDKLLVSKVIDKNDNASTKVYDANNRLKEEKDQNGYITRYLYDINGNVTKKTDPKGNVTTMTYDVLGNIKEERIPNKVTVHTYDKFGKLLTTKENNRIMLSNTYDQSYNQLTKVTDALGHTTMNTYDRYNNLIKEDKAGYITEKSYDKLGKLIKTIENTDKITVYEYDAMGRETKQTQNDKVIKASVYDAMGNVVEAYENGLTKRHTYDGMNRVEKTIYPSASGNFDIEFMNAYDETGNLVIEVDPYGNMKTREYSPTGEVVLETDENEHTTRFAYDGVGNLTKVQNALDRIVQYTYDGNKNQTAKYINDRKATYTYDTNNHLTKETNEYNKDTKYRYDVNGKLLEHEKPDGTKITYTYDALGNKLTEGSRKYTYDNHNNVKTASDGVSTLTYTYDKYNRIQSVKKPYNSDVTYEWDIYGNKTNITYKDKCTDYEYNDMNKVTKVSYNGEQMATYTYDLRGNIASMVNGDYSYHQTNYTYDKLSRRIESDTIGRLNMNSQYTYDATGNILSETINGKKNTYTYDEMNELKSSSKYINGKQVTTKYGYDLYGNKTEVTTDGNYKRYHYNKNNELTNIYTKEGNTDIYYDKNGNMRDILYAGGEKDHYEYDEYGQLSTVTNSKDEYYNFRYDAEGDRDLVEKWVDQGFDKELWYEKLSESTFEEVKALLNDKNSEQTFDAMRYQSDYLSTHGTCAIMPDSNKDFNKYNASQIVDKTQEYSEVLATNVGDFHIYGEDERLYSEARGENRSENKITYVNGNNNSVYAENIINKTEGNSTSSSRKEIEYDDFGNTDDIIKGYGYNGEALDETGLIYLRARYYNPKIGQFIQEDSYVGEQKDIESQNRYAFVKQNPYKYVDKDGHMAIVGSDRPGHPEENVNNYWKERKKAEEREKNLKETAERIVNSAKETIKEIKEPTKEKPETGEKEVEKPKPKPKCTFTESISQWFRNRGRDLANFTSNIYSGITKGVGRICDSVSQGVDKLIRDPGALFGDVYNAVISSITSLKFWALAGVTGALAVATGGQSLWVQALVIGTGSFAIEESYVFASTGFSIDKFFEIKGVENFGEYLGQALLTDALAVGFTAGGLKLSNYIKGLKKGASGAEKKYKYELDIQLFAKNDLKQITDAANQVGINRTKFGNYIHEIKADLGMKANQNFTFQELLDLANEFKKFGGK